MNRTRIVFALTAAVVALAIAAPEASAQTPALKVKHLGPCRDQWINYAYMEKLGRNPIGAKNPGASHARQDFGECNCNLYAGCSWNSYAQLEQGVVAWNNYTREARVIVQNTGGAFKVLRSLDRTPVGVVIRNATGQMFDFMGKMLGGYSLMSANAKDLGNGTKVEFK